MDASPMATEPIETALPSPGDFEEITLTTADAIDPLIFIPPSKRVFGRGPDVEFGGLRLRIGRRPTAINLWDLYQRSNRELPPEDQIEVYNGYQLWLFL